MRASIAIPVLLVALTLGLTLFAYLRWSEAGIYLVSGDEPHYLVIAKSLLQKGTLEVSETYRDEMISKSLYLPGMSEHDRDGHIVSGYHGMFSAHNIGLPLLLVIPLAIAGVFGAKLFIIFLSALAIGLIWRVSGQFSTNLFMRANSTLLVCLSPLILAGGTQIYPDILSGIICLFVLHCFHGSPFGISSKSWNLAMALLFLLPWLQIKLVLPMGIFWLAHLIPYRTNHPPLLHQLTITIGVVASLIALALYNEYAFGNFFGPYSNGALEVSQTSLMVLGGLLMDQNQGFLFQNPIHFIGVVYLFSFIRNDPKFAVLWALIWVSLWLPNGLHTTWYGGGCLSGRFEWASALVFAYPTLYGLSRIRSQVIALLLVVHVMVQAWLYSRYVNHEIDLFNRGPETWSDAYSIFFPGISKALPMLYSPNWAFDWAPNYLWIGVIFGLMTCGAIGELSPRFRTLMLGLGLSGFVFLGGRLPVSRAEPMLHFDLKSLPSQTGTLINGVWHAEMGNHRPGYLIFGPYLPLAPGRYCLELSYKSPSSQPTAKLEVFNSTRQEMERAQDLQPTLSSIARIEFEVKAPFWSRDRYEFRVQWSGRGYLAVEDLRLFRTP